MSGTSRYEIDIIANNKASKALSKTNKQLQKIDANAKKSNSALKSMGALAASAGVALGGIKLAQSFMNTATQFENLNVQLKFITGNAKSGAQALGIVEAAASRSAFAMEDMAAAAPSLLTVSSVDELASTLDMAGDIAAATGMSFQEVSSQLQRAFSGGIAAADMFREKGVKSMLGFQEGVQYTAEETERMIRDAFENGTTSLAGATAEMAKTWDGQISMMGDAWMQFKKRTVDSGLFDALKDQLARVRGFLDDNKAAIDKMAEALGSALATAVRALGDAVAFTVEHFDFFVTLAKGFVAIKLASMINKVVPAMKALNIAFRLNPIGFLIGAVASLVGYLSVKNGLGRTIVQVQAVLDTLGGALASFGNFLYGKLGKAVQWMKDKFFDFVDGLITAYNWLAKLVPGMEEIEKNSRELGEAISDGVGGAIEYVTGKAGDMGQALLDSLPDELADTITAAAEAAKLAGEQYDITKEAAAALAEQNRLLEEATSHIDPVMTLAAEKTKQLREEAEKLAESEKAAAVAAGEWATEWTRLQEQLFPVATEMAEINAMIETLNQKIAEGGPNTDAYAAAIVKLKQKLVELDPETQRLIESMNNYDDALIRIARNQKADAEAKLEMKEAASQLYDQLHPLETQMKEHNKDLELAKKAYDEGFYSATEYAKVQKRIREEMKKTSEVTKKATSNIKKQTDEVGKGFEDFADKFNKDFNSTLADGLVEGNLNFSSFADLWKSTLKELITDTLNNGTLLKDAMSWLGNLFGGGGGGGVSLPLGLGSIGSGGASAGYIPNIVSGFSNATLGPAGLGLLPQFADGGQIKSGETGIVGEAGMELVTGPATVTPNSEIGGAKPAVNITIQAIDTQTGTEFLLKNKKQIEGIIQHAYNRRGKQGIY